MTGEEEVVGSLLKSTLGIAHTEDLIVEAVRELVKDEVKRYVRERLEERPGLKEELKAGIGALLEAKVKEAAALVLIAKSAAKLGVELVPAHLREEVARELVGALERDLTRVLEGA